MPAPPPEAMPKALKPAPTKKPSHLRRLAEDEVAVRREALRAVDELLDPGLLQRRHAAERQLHDRLEMVPVAVEQLEVEALGNAALRPGHRVRLVAAHDEAADLLLVVGEPVRVAQRRQPGRDARRSRSVIRYWCCTLTSGTLTPAMRPSARDHWPAQQTTLSQATKPCVGLDAASPGPSSTRMPVTRTSSRIVTPFCARPARQRLHDVGRARPGRRSAGTPRRPRRRRSSAARAPAPRAGVSRCISSPKERAVVACRFTSVQRSGVQASRRPPFRFQPVASPVSASSRS